jgi:two-component system, chemotaxis family, protein-glutamate methylesterase/glutaminase
LTRPSFELVVIAASAGGLSAISAGLASLPVGFPAAVVVLQHLDPNHSSEMDDILRRRTALTVSMAQQGAPIAPGAVIIAPPGRHLLINTDATLELSDTARVQFVRPSADLLFESAAASYGERVIGVVLTGKGVDGNMGVRAIKQAGGIVIAQDEATSQSFGMPGAAIDTGAVDMVLPLTEIGPALSALTGRASP